MFNLIGNYFNGKFHMQTTSGAGATEIFIKRYSPSDNSNLLWNLAVDYSHIDTTLESAVSGFKIWRNTPVSNRIEILKKYQENLKVKADELALSIAHEIGKPLWEAKTEVASLISKIDVTINDSLPRILTKNIENILPDTKGSIHFKPIGPCLIIGPFNFPCHLANGQILSALISGNSIIFKPSEKACYSAQLMFECLASSGDRKSVV